jgi:uncharacterized protein (TIGR00730 family)
VVEQRGDAFIALPGGLGTLEEFFEIVVGRVLGFHAKPIVLLNVGDFYRPMLTMIEHAIEHRFIKASALDAFHVTQSVESAIDRIENESTTPSPSGVSTHVE